MKICSVVFDLEGTLVNLENIHHGAFLRVANDLGLDLDFDTAYQKIPSWIGGGDPAIARDLAVYTHSSASAEKILAHKIRYYEEMLKEVKLCLRPGFMRIYQWLLKDGVPMFIGSLTAIEQASYILAETHLNDLFPRKNIILREDVARVKPDPEIYLKTAKLAGVKTADQLVFEDSPTGIRAAVASGSIAIGMPVYLSTKIVGDILSFGARRIFWDWRDIDIEGLFDSLTNQTANDS